MGSEAGKGLVRGIHILKSTPKRQTTDADPPAAGTAGVGGRFAHLVRGLRLSFQRAKLNSGRY